MSELQPPMSAPIQLLGISGSLRKASYSTAILRAFQTVGSGTMASLRLFPLDDVPPYNQDVEDQGAPDAVQALRTAVQQGQGLIVASPEYNGGISGVLKNALDWLSRPQGRGALVGKPVLPISSSPGARGGMRAQAQLRQVLEALTARVVEAGPQIMLALVREQMRDGQLVDPASLEHLARGLRALEQEIRSIVP